MDAYLGLTLEKMDNISVLELLGLKDTLLRCKAQLNCSKYPFICKKLTEFLKGIETELQTREQILKSNSK